MTNRFKKLWPIAIVVLALFQGVLSATGQLFNSAHTNESVLRAGARSAGVALILWLGFLGVAALVAKVLPAFWDRHPRVRGGYFGVVLGMVNIIASSDFARGVGGLPSIGAIAWSALPLGLFFFLTNGEAGEAGENRTGQASEPSAGTIG